MRNIINLLMTFLSIVLLFTGCSGKNGATGPAGPAMPVVQSLSIQGLPALPGSAVTATVIAQSARDLALSYTWTVSNGWVITGGGNTPTVTMRAPAAYDMTGTATIEVSDTQGSTVTGMISLSTKGSSFPVINTMSASPNPAFPGAEVQAVVSAYDPDGNTLSYTWTATTGWSITGYGATATVTAPAAYNTGGSIGVMVSNNYGAAVTGTIAVGTITIIPPLQPANLVVTPGDGRVGLTWSAAAYAASYNIYMSTMSGEPYTKVGSSASTSDTVTGLANGTVYYFVVTAVNSFGESGYSNQVSTKPFGTETYAVGSVPIGIAIDSSDNIWVTNVNSNAVTELSSTGALIGTYPVGSSPIGVAIDGLGNVWVANSGSGNLTELNSSGITVMTYPVGGTPLAVTIDSFANILVSTYSNGSVVELVYNGPVISHLMGGFPEGIAIDAYRNVWVAINDSDSVTVNYSGTIAVGISPAGVAIDSENNVWVVNSGSGNVTELNSSGVTIGTYAVGSGPTGIAIDSANNVWVTNSGSNSVTELDSSGSTIETYPVGFHPLGIAIDSSGNVYVVNQNSNNVTKLVGIAVGPQYFPYAGPQFPGGGNF